MSVKDKGRWRRVKQEEPSDRDADLTPMKGEGEEKVG